jgi:hypothetical protein
MLADDRGPTMSLGAGDAGKICDATAPWEAVDLVGVAPELQPARTATEAMATKSLPAIPISFWSRGLCDAADSGTWILRNR